MTISIKSPTSTTGSIQLNGNDVLTIDSSGNLTAPNNLTVTGNVATSGTIPAANLTGALPALNGSALTNLTSANLTGALPALNGSALTNLTSANLTGALPAIDGSALTGIAGGKVTKCTQVFLSNSVTSGGTQRTLSGTDWTYTDNSIIKGSFTKSSSSTLLIVQGHTSWTNTSGNCHGTYTWVGTNTTGANTQRYHHALDPYRQNGNKGNHTFTAIFSGLASGTYYALHGSGRGDTGSTTNVVNYNPQSYVGGDTPNENSRSHILVFEVEV